MPLYHFVIKYTETKKIDVSGENQQNKKLSKSYKASFIKGLQAFYIRYIKIIDIYIYINYNYFIYLHLLIYKRIKTRYNKNMEYLLT